MTAVGGDDMRMSLRSSFDSTMSSMSFKGKPYLQYEKPAAYVDGAQTYCACPPSALSATCPYVTSLACCRLWDHRHPPGVGLDQKGGAVLQGAVPRQ